MNEWFIFQEQTIYLFFKKCSKKLLINIALKSDDSVEFFLDFATNCQQVELIQQRILKIRSKNLNKFDWFFYWLANSARIWHLKCTAQKRRTHKILTFFEYQWSWLNNENTFVLFFQQQSKTNFLCQVFQMNIHRSNM